jgi:hypothetical protein
MKPSRSIGLVAISFLAFSAVGNAAVAIYHSTAGGPDPDPGGEYEVPNSSSELIVLNLDGGNIPTTTGEVCLDGDGEEVCGVDVTIKVIKGSILSFSAASSQIASHISSSSIEIPIPNQIRIVAVLAINPPEDVPPTADPFYLGDLEIDATAGTSLFVVVTSGEAVDAHGDIVAVPLRTIAVGTVPEPALWLMLTAGSALLSALGRRRLRMPKHRV